jgi:hypothetical protein
MLTLEKMVSGKTIEEDSEARTNTVKKFDTLKKGVNRSHQMLKSSLEQEMQLNAELRKSY